MTRLPVQQFESITSKYSQLKIAVVGDFCLDRYLEIDPTKQEASIETGLPVHNVTRLRSQPGAAGTILNNLVALGVGEIFAVGFCGEDGEGYELRRCLHALRGVNVDHFATSTERRTFVYCKPLVIHADRPPEELSRLDSKNWTPTPQELQERLANSIAKLAKEVDALVLMDQVDVEETGVVTHAVAQAARAAIEQRPQLLTLADSRRGLQNFPELGFKMNVDELGHLAGNLNGGDTLGISQIQELTSELAAKTGQPVFVTLAEKGIVGATATDPAEHVSAFPAGGTIDIVGAGDAVMANLVAALAAGASCQEAMQLAMAAASVVVHQLGTTGTATVGDLQAKLLHG